MKISTTSKLKDYVQQPHDPASEISSVDRMLQALHIRLDEERKARLKAERRAASAEKRNRQITKQATVEKFTDGGTGIPNRKFFDEYLGLVHKAAYAKKFSYAVIIADIDFFKSVNEDHSHLAGDLILSNLSNLLLRGHRTEDMVANIGKGLKQHGGTARYGGEEFALILPNCSLANAEKIAEEMRRAFETYTHDLSAIKTKSGVKSLTKTATFGVAVYDPTIDADQHSVVTRADLALNAGKHKFGKNCVIFSTNGHEFHKVDQELNLSRSTPLEAVLPTRGQSQAKMSATRKLGR